MQTQPKGLDRLLEVVDRIQRRCTGPSTPRPLRLSGSKPRLEVPRIASLLAPSLTAIFRGPQRVAILQAAEALIVSFRQEAYRAFQNTIQRLISVEDVGGIADSVIEQRLCLMFEVEYERHNMLVRERVREVLSAHLSVNGEEGSKKGNGFGHVSSVISCLCI